MLVTIKVNQAAAILAGHDRFGPQTVDVAPAELSEAHRVTLARVADTIRHSSHGTDKAINLVSLWHNGSQHFGSGYPELASADLDAVRVVLDAQAALDADAEAKAKAKAAQEAGARALRLTQWEAEQRKWLATPDADLLYRGVSGAIEAREPRRNLDGFPVLPDVEIRLAALRQAAAERTAADKARWEAATAKAKAEGEAAAARRTAQLAAILAGAPEHMQKRAARKLLPESELIDWYRDQLFAPLDAFPRYVRLTKTDVYAAAGQDEGDGYRGELEFDTRAADEASAEAFDGFEAIERVAGAKLAPAGAVTVTLQTHSGGFDRDKEWLIQKHSVRVELKVGELTLSRLYECPKEPTG